MDVGAAGTRSVTATSRRAPLVALVSPAGAAAAPDGGLADCLVAAGWTVETLEPERLRGVDLARWLVAIVQAERVNEASLALTAQAARRPDTRVAFASPDRDPQHIADALRVGADDYLVLPTAPEECLARLASLAAHAAAIRERGDGGRTAGQAAVTRLVSLDPITRTVRDGAARVSLSSREWDVLAALLATAERSVSAAELARAIWGSAREQARVVSTVSRLRRKLAGAGVQAIDVETVRGLGYTARLAG